MEPSGRDCIFCRIASHEIPSQIVYEDEQVVAFRDINPKAPVHLLVIPRRHIPSLNDLGRGGGDAPGADETLVGRLFTVARDMAARFGIAEDGYRVVANCGERAGQSVFHIHLHLLGGRAMSWPPG